MTMSSGRTYPKGIINNRYQSIWEQVLFYCPEYGTKLFRSDKIHRHVNKLASFLTGTYLNKKEKKGREKMLEWLQTILENAAVTDGKLDIAAVMNTVKTEFPKHAVPKDDFNAKVNELKTATDTIATLKKDAGDNEELQKKIKTYEGQLETLRTEQARTAKTYALKDRLKEAGVIDPDYVIYKKGGLDKFTFDKDGAPIGVNELLDPMRKESPHLFKVDPGADYSPTGGGKTAVNNPFAKETFNLTEQGRLLRENPAQAKQLAAAAGVTI